MNLLTIGVTSFLVALGGALAPGPLLMVTVQQSLRRGAATGPLIVVGHAILELGLVIILLLGFGKFLQQPAVLAVLSLAGGTLLIWMGTGMARSVRTASISDTPGSSGKNSLVWSGILVSLSNPYWTVWWATVGLMYISLAFPRGFPGVLVFFIGHISADLLWYTAVSCSLARGRDRIPLTVYRGILAFCGMFLIVFGTWLIAAAIRKRLMS